MNNSIRPLLTDNEEIMLAVLKTYNIIHDLRTFLIKYSSNCYVFFKDFANKGDSGEYTFNFDLTIDSEENDDGLTAKCILVKTTIEKTYLTFYYSYTQDEKELGKIKVLDNEEMTLESALRYVQKNLCSFIREFETKEEEILESEANSDSLFETMGDIFRPIELNSNANSNYVLDKIDTLEKKGIKKGIYNPFNFEIRHEGNNE